MSDPRIAVIGLGNPLMGDDGAGLAALERLREHWDVPDHVELVDGGTWGMNLLPVIEDADAVVFIDAIRAGCRPGEPVTLERYELPAWVAIKLSPHQIDLKEVLALAEVRGTLPDRAVAIGVEPGVIALQDALSPVVAATLDLLVQRVVARLEQWGAACAPKDLAACTR